MWALLRFIKDRLVWVLPVAMGLGLALGALFDMSFLKGAILPLTMLMVLPMMVNLQWRTLASRDGGGVLVLTQAYNFIFVPLVAFAVAVLVFPGNVPAITGLVLMGSLPTSGMTLSWTGFAGGNVKASLRNVLVSLVLGALLLPVYLRLFLGQTSDIPLDRLFRQIGLVILVPMVIGGILGGVLRQRMGRDSYTRDVKPKMPLISSGAVVLMVAAAMALKAPSILRAPEAILLSLAALALFYGILFLSGHILGRLLLRREDALAFLFSSAVRNLSIALALSLSLLGESGGTASLLTSLAFLIQVQAAAWYVRLEGRRGCADCPEKTGAAAAGPGN